MASLISTTELKYFVTTSVGDSGLQMIIDSEELEMTQRFGAHTTQTDELDYEIPGQYAFLTRKASSVSEVIETIISQVFADSVEQSETTLDSTDYELTPDGMSLRRLASGVNARYDWGNRVKVTYTPEAETAKRKMVLVDLCKLTLGYKAAKSESVGAGEYSMTFVEYQAERERILSTLAVNQRGIA